MLTEPPSQSHLQKHVLCLKAHCSQEPHSWPLRLSPASNLLEVINAKVLWNQAVPERDNTGPLDPDFPATPRPRASLGHTAGQGAGRAWERVLDDQEIEAWNHPPHSKDLHVQGSTGTRPHVGPAYQALTPRARDGLQLHPSPWGDGLMQDAAQHTLVAMAAER